MTAAAAPTVLALDLSTTRGAIAVVRGEEVLFETTFVAERSHNAQVFAPLGQALSVIGSAPAVVVVGTGPGSYTGVRIAIAAAQGVALSRDWPVIGWPSITTGEGADYNIIGDARRGHFYTAQVRNRTLGPIQILDAETARAQVAGDATLPWLTFDAKAPLELPQVQITPPHAARLGQIVSQLSALDLADFGSRPLEPLYLQGAFITVAKKAGKAVPVG